MRRLMLGIASIVLLAPAAHSQTGLTKLKVRIVLVDKDLNQKPVPQFALVLRAEEAAGAPITLTTGFDGLAEAAIPVGKYRLSSPQPIEFQGKRYQWEMEITVGGLEFHLDLSNNNANTAPVAVALGVQASDDLSAQFKHLRNSVATVYSELGHGTGFLVDAKGLVVTNEHVISKSEYLAVQFDEKRKVAATLLVSDPQKDVAVLWVNLSAYPQAVIAPLSTNEPGKAPAVEGERVFTIGSPLTQQKLLTTGVISRVEAKSIISDININPGNSGGPLFNSAGVVIGVTTFSQQADQGPGLSGIVRIEEAAPLIEQARMKLAGATVPSAALLPVEPLEPFPMDALRAIATEGKIDRAAYIFAAGDFEIELSTPALEYRLHMERQRALEKEREKRNKKRGDNETENTGGSDLKDWETRELKPTVTVNVIPQLKVKFWATMADRNHEIKARFKTDFYRMRILCGTQEIVSIRPGKRKLAGGEGASSSIEDTTYMGAYEYLPDAINPSCGTVTLEIYPDKSSPPTVKPLDSATIQAVWKDFEPYRQAVEKTAAPAPSKN
jgi:S1-C subfamily serine protease